MIDEQARAEGATVGAVRDLIPKECFRISPARSWAALATACVRLAFAILILTRIDPVWGPSLLWQIPALAAAWLFAGWCYTGLFVIGHDCGHMAFSERRWVNEVVGHLCLSPVYTGFHNWRIWHNYHHAKTQLRGQDPDWPEKMLTREEYDRAKLGDRAHVRLGLGTPLGLLVGFWVGMFRRTFMRTTAPQIPLTRGSERELLLSSTIMFATSGRDRVGALPHGRRVAAGEVLPRADLHRGRRTARCSRTCTTRARTPWSSTARTGRPSAGRSSRPSTSASPGGSRRSGSTSTSTCRTTSRRGSPGTTCAPRPRRSARRAPSGYQERRFSLAYLRASWARPLIARAPGHDYYVMAPYDAAAVPDAAEAPDEARSLP